MRIYTGIGSRKTPKQILVIFEQIGTFLANNGFILRSGHAEGADVAFEKGCDSVNGVKEIYLPWYKFNESNSTLNKVHDQAFKMAAKYYKYWENFKPGVQKLLARDCQQVLGENLDRKTDFVVCYTEDGKLKGGTAMALRIAKSYNITIFNVGSYDDINKFKQDFSLYLSTNYGITGLFNE